MDKPRYRYYPREYKFINFLVIIFTILFFSFTTAVALSPWWLIYAILQEGGFGVEGVLMLLVLTLAGIPASIWYFYNLGYIAFMEKHFPQKMQIDKINLLNWFVIFQRKHIVFSAGKRYLNGHVSLYRKGNIPADIQIIVKPDFESEYFLENDQVLLQLVFPNKVIDLEKNFLEYVFKIGTKNISYFLLSFKYPNEEIISAFCNSPTVTVVYQNEGYDGFEVTYDITGFKDVYDMMLTYLPEIPREEVKYDL